MYNVWTVENPLSIKNITFLSINFQKIINGYLNISFHWVFRILWPWGRSCLLLESSVTEVTLKMIPCHRLPHLCIHSPNKSWLITLFLMRQPWWPFLRRSFEGLVIIFETVTQCKRESLYMYVTRFLIDRFFLLASTFLFNHLGRFPRFHRLQCIMWVMGGSNGKADDWTLWTWQLIGYDLMNSVADWIWYLELCGWLDTIFWT